MDKVLWFENYMVRSSVLLSSIITDTAFIVVYGTAVPMHARDPTLFQHQGIGTLLMEEAERIAREEHGSMKLAVISGIGVRGYYAKLGYSLEGPYMTLVSLFSFLRRDYLLISSVYGNRKMLYEQEDEE